MEGEKENDSRSCDDNLDEEKCGSERNDASDNDDEEEDDVNEDDLSDDEYYHDPGSDDEENCCPICLNDFEEQQIGVPNNCKHVFCVDCILEWSKKANSCPVDRIKFQNVLVFHRIGGLFNREVSIQNNVLKSDEEEEVTLCQICRGGHDEATLLLCDGCDLAFHCACLSPPLDDVPAGEWFCDRCKEERGEAPTPVQPRLIGRTNLSERVRTRISRTRQRNVEVYSNLDEQLDAIVDEVLQTFNQRFRETESSKVKRQKMKTKPIKRRRSRKRRRASRKRSKSRPRKATSNSRSVSKTSRSNTSDEYPGSSELSLTGRANDLNEFDTNTDENEVPSHVIAKRHRLLTQSAIKYNTPLPSLFSLHVEEETSYPPLSPPPPMPDILSSILSGQDMLFTPSNQVTIKRDGNLEVKTKPKPSPPSDRKETIPIKLRSTVGKLRFDTTKANEEKTRDRSENAVKPDKTLSLESAKKSEQSSDQTGFSSRTTASSASSKSSIMIKPIFSLPKAKKPSFDAEEGWQPEDAVAREEAYDPFRPTETDEELDEVMEDKEDDEDILSESAPEPSSSSSDEEFEVIPVINEETEAVQTTKKEPEINVHVEDDFEIDIFAEEELEKAQDEANRKAAETVRPDPLKMWRDEVRQTSVSEDLHITLPTLRLKDSSPIPMKFKKRSRKDKANLPQPDGSVKSHYRTRKTSDSKNAKKKNKRVSSESPEPPTSVRKREKKTFSPVPPPSTQSNRSKPNKVFAQHEASSYETRNEFQYEQNPLRSHHRREATKPAKKKLSPERERVRHISSTSNSSYKDDARLKKKKSLPNDESEKTKKKKRKVQEPDFDRAKKERRVEKEKWETYRMLSPTNPQNPPLSYNIDDDLLWSLNPPSSTTDQVTLPVKNKERKSQKRESRSRHRKDSSVETNNPLRRTYSSYSSERELESKKKKKRKGLPKKKKHSRSPKKRVIKKKKINNNHNTNSDLSVSNNNLSFEHIFADFDNLKKTKKKKRKEEREKKSGDSDEQIVFIEEEVPVIYDDESLSEGEIRSSGDEIKRLIKRKINYTNEIQQTSSALRSIVVSKPSCAVINGTKTAVSTATDVEASKVKSQLKSKTVHKPHSISSVKNGHKKVEQSVAQQLNESLELDILEFDDGIVVEEQEMDSESSSPRASSKQNDFGPVISDPPKAEIALSNDNPNSTYAVVNPDTVKTKNQVQLSHSPQSLLSPQTLQSTKANPPSIKTLLSPKSFPSFKTPPFSPRSSIFPTKSKEFVPTSQIPEPATVKSKSYVTNDDNNACQTSTSSMTCTTSAVVSVSNKTPIKYVIANSTPENIPNHPQLVDEPASSVPDILPLVDYLKTMKRESFANSSDFDEKDAKTSHNPVRFQAKESKTKKFDESTKSSSGNQTLAFAQFNQPSLPTTYVNKTSSNQVQSQIQTIYVTPSSSNQISTQFQTVYVNQTSSNQVPFMPTVYFTQMPTNQTSFQQQVAPSSAVKNSSESTSITINNDYSKPRAEKKKKPDQDPEFDPLMIPINDSKNLRTTSTTPPTVTVKNTDLYSPSFPISPASSDGLKVNNVVKRHDVSTGVLMTVDEKVTRYLKNTAEVKVRNKSTSQSRRRKHSSHSAKKHRSAKESPSSSSYIKETASNPLDFQRKVVEVAKASIMPYFKRREVSKEQYKEIMKKAVNKICKDARVKNNDTVDSSKVKKLVKKYVGSCLHLNEKQKEKMRRVLNRKVDQHIKGKSELDFSTSPPSPVEDSPTDNVSPKITKNTQLSPPPFFKSRR